MKLRRTDNEYRPIEPALFTDSAAFHWLLLAISVVFGFAASFWITFIWK